MSPAADDEVTDILAAWAHRFDALRAQLAEVRAADDGSAAARQAHIDVQVTLIVALVDELEEEQAEIELAVLLPLVAHDAAVEVETRMRLAAELVAMSERELAIVQLRAAHERARGTALETTAGIALADVLRDHERHAEARAVLGEAPAGATPEVAARLALSRASVAEGEAAEALCRTAVEHARKTTDLELQHAAAVALAELLAAREALEEAEAVLEDLPPLDDALESRALLEEIWRRLGSHLVDDEDEPDEPGEMDRQLRAYITKPRSFAQGLVDGGLASPERVREWSHGELREPADLESQRIFGPVRSFWCACGRYRGRAYAGMVCRRCGVELVHAVARRMRAGHIALAQPVVHPWYAVAATQLLGRQIDDVAELRAALQGVDLDGLVDDLKREIVTAAKAKIADAAGRRLAVVEAFRTAYKQTYTRPEHIVLEIVPVVPPHGELGCDREKVRAAYAQLLEGGDPDAGIRTLFAAFSAQ